MRKYIIIRENDQDWFEKTVSRKIKEGYVPLGSMQYNWFAGVYTQAMILLGDGFKNSELLHELKMALFWH